MEVADKEPGRIFVYGTLMQGMRNHYLISPFIQSVEQATAKGQLVHLTLQGYPMFFAGTETVFGELLQVTDEEKALIILDRLENFFGSGHPDNLYERCQIHVAGELETKNDVWIYIGADAILDCLGELTEPVTSGDWRAFIAERSMGTGKNV